jgi:predicted secreted protein
LESADDGSSITVDVEDTISIILSSNAITGYQWVLDEDELDPDIVSETSRKYFPGNPYLVGSGGSEQWLFEAKGAGTTTIKLDYKRIWETSIEDTFEIEVTVE